MPNKNILFVIGAGASVEAKVPTGDDLKDTISNLLDIRYKRGYEKISGDGYINDAIRQYVKHNNDDRSFNEYLHACWAIRDGLPQARSIDSYIDTHAGDKKIELCGKLGIVRSILDAEQNSLMHVDLRSSQSKLDVKVLTKTWFNSFIQLINDGCRPDNLEERLSNIKLIIFNYDRCVENFLYYSLQNYFRLDHSAAEQLVNNMDIYHPYGTVGYLPWQNLEPFVDFGANVNASSLLSLTEQVKTFMEGTDKTSSKISAIHDAVKNAEIIVFLGFSYQKLNMELLTPDDTSELTSADYKCFGTAVGISPPDCEIIKNDVQSMKGIMPEHCDINSNLTCSKLFREYWRSLSLS